MNREQREVEERRKATGEGHQTAVVHVRDKCRACSGGKSCPGCIKMPCLTCVRWREIDKAVIASAKNRARVIDEIRRGSVVQVWLPLSDR